MIFNIIFGIVLWCLRESMSDIAFNVCWWINIIAGIISAVFIGIEAYKYCK